MAEADQKLKEDLQSLPSGSLDIENIEDDQEHVEMVGNTKSKHCFFIAFFALVSFAPYPFVGFLSFPNEGGIQGAPEEGRLRGKLCPPHNMKELPFLILVMQHSMAKIIKHS